MSKENKRFYSSFCENYELIDAGGGQKLERWGEIITIRPERQAYFKSGLPFAEWEQKAHWKFKEKTTQKGNWQNIQFAPKFWHFNSEGILFKLELTQYKHIGLFPEQYTNWKFLSENLHANSRFLNLFAYTGASSIFAKKNNAEVIHVDSVKQLIAWAKTNMELSELSDIKWVLEDALKFAEREVKRGNRYEIIQMDPPAWGIGAKGEKWKLEEKIEELVQTAHQLLESQGWLLLNTYSPSLKIGDLQRITERIFGKRAELCSELWMKTATRKELYFGDLIRIQKK